ncbi:chaperone protein AfaB, partial [Escherichia coli]|nr:chaperone protein AfaB [Escherichia coli]
MKMRAVAVFTGMLTGVLSVAGLLSAGAYAAGGEGNMSASATETNA